MLGHSGLADVGLISGGAVLLFVLLLYSNTAVYTTLLLIGVGGA